MLFSLCVCTVLWVVCWSIAFLTYLGKPKTMSVSTRGESFFGFVSAMLLIVRTVGVV